MKVARLLGLEFWKERASEKPMKMFARNYLAEIFSINIQSFSPEYFWMALGLARWTPGSPHHPEDPQASTS